MAVISFPPLLSPEIQRIAPLLRTFPLILSFRTSRLSPCGFSFLPKSTLQRNLNICVVSCCNVLPATRVLVNYKLPTWCINYYLFIKLYVPLHVSSFKCSSSGGHTVYMQHMVLSLSTRVRGGLVRTKCREKVVGRRLKTPANNQSLQSVLTQTVHQQTTTNSRREWQHHMLHVYSVSSWRRAFKARNM